MATLKTISTVIIWLIAFSGLAAQYDSRTSDAFAKSYKAEQNGSYTEGVDALKSIYQADNYSVNARLGWLLFWRNSTQNQLVIMTRP